MMWAIKNKRTRKWLYGTCFGRPATQRTSFQKAMLFEDYEEAQMEFERRQCGNDYKICLVKLEEARTDEVCDETQERVDAEAEYIDRQAAIDELMSTVERNRNKGDRFGGELIHWTGVKAILDRAPGIRFGWTRVSDELPPDDHRVLVRGGDENDLRRRQLPVMKSAELVPVESGVFECSRCRHRILWSPSKIENIKYCWNCGACLQTNLTTSVFQPKTKKVAK